jgi:hypothetical protein
MVCYPDPLQALEVLACATQPLALHATGPYQEARAVDQVLEADR